MNNTTNLHFSLPYDEVISKAQSIQPQFASDREQFSVFNPWFTSAVNSELVVNTAAAIADYSESSHTASIERETEKISGLLEQSGKSYQKLIYYVEKGLGDSKAMSDTFGHSRYEKARNSEKEMISLLHQANSAIWYKDNNTKLVAAGMPNNFPNELLNFATELAAADGEQEMLKKQQLLITSQRIVLFNSIWDTLSEICKAAKIIFEDDEARLQIYRLYDTPAPKPVEPENQEA